MLVRDRGHPWYNASDASFGPRRLQPGDLGLVVTQTASNRGREESPIRYHDKNLTCSDCSGPFPFSAEDQGLSGELGYDQPIRCRSCHSSQETTRRHTGRNAAPGGRIAHLAAIMPLAIAAPALL